MGIESVFNEVPSGDSWLVPGGYIEFSNRRANSSSLSFSTLLIAPKLSTGTQDDFSILRYTRAEEALEYLGAGSIGNLMVQHALNNAKAIDLQVLAMPDAGSAVAASAPLTITGAASALIVFEVRIAGQKTSFQVASGTSQNDIAIALAAAVTAEQEFIVNAAVDGGNANQVNFACKQGGEIGNSINVEVVAVNTQPASPVISDSGIADLAGGAVNPDLVDAIASMGDEWYQVVICPFIDAANLAALEAELEDRWTALRQIGGLGFVGVPGTHGEATTHAAARNSFSLISLPTNNSDSLPFELSAMVAAIAAEGFLSCLFGS